MGANRIIDNLWMGSAPPEGDELCVDFDCLVLCAVEYQPTDFPGLEVERIELYDDGLNLLTKEQMRKAIKLASGIVNKLKDGKRVLITCYQGLNRSGLIVALSIMLFRNMTPEQAILTIRENRSPIALCNPDFVDFIKLVGSILQKRQQL
jgi:protein-tyrosine phosphatase